MPEGEVLFELSSTGFEFFFILVGNVTIAVDIYKDDAKQAKALSDLKEKPDLPIPQKSKERFKSKFPGVPKSPLVTNSQIIRKENGYHVIHRGRLLGSVNVLREGMAFGDVALNEGTVRNATILVSKSCYFGVLDKTNYTRIIGEHYTRLHKEKLKFIRCMPVFSTFKSKDITTILPELHLETLNYRDFVVREGQLLKKLYIVLKGRVRVHKKMDVHNRTTYSNSEVIFMKNNHSNKEQRYIQICVLTEGEIIALDSLIQGRPVEYDYVCDSQKCEL